MSRRKETWRRKLRRVAIELGPPENRGEIYATRFASALEELEKEGKIISWKETEQYSELDCQGVDFLVATKKRGVVPFQITSTWEKAEEKKEKLAEKGANIPVVYLVPTGGENAGELFPVDLLKKTILHKIRSYRKKDGWVS